MPLSDASASEAGTSWAAMSTLSSEIFQPSACNPASDRPYPVLEPDLHGHVGRLGRRALAHHAFADIRGDLVMQILQLRLFPRARLRQTPQLPPQFGLPVIPRFRTGPVLDPFLRVLVEIADHVRRQRKLRRPALVFRVRKTAQRVSPAFARAARRIRHRTGSDAFSSSWHVSSIVGRPRAVPSLSAAGPFARPPLKLLNPPHLGALPAVPLTQTVRGYPRGCFDGLLPFVLQRFLFDSLVAAMSRESNRETWSFSSFVSFDVSGWRRRLGFDGIFVLVPKPVCVS